jgi:hypothetical protein
MTRRFHDDCRILEAAVLYRCGCLNPGQYTWKWDQPGSPRVSTEIVTDLDAVRLENQHVPFEWKSCRPTRGAQPLWRCPTCGRRCAKLYSPVGGLFRCRACWELKYRVCNEGQMMRHLRYAAQIGVPLAGAPADGSVPLSYRSRDRNPRRSLHRARIREVMAVLVLELLRDDDADGDGLY